MVYLEYQLLACSKKMRHWLNPESWLGPATPLWMATARPWHNIRTITLGVLATMIFAFPDPAQAQPEPLCTGEKGPGCWIEVLDHAGCYIWNHSPQIQETVTWTGDCIDGKLSGTGEKEWLFLKDGKEVKSSGHGEYVDGKQNGHWVYRFEDGAVGEGLYIDGKLNGHWVYRFEDGFVSEGLYIDDKRDGHWVIRYADGAVGEGLYIDDKRDGHWIGKTKYGQNWELPYKRNKANGIRVVSDDTGLIINCMKLGNFRNLSVCNMFPVDNIKMVMRQEGELRFGPGAEYSLVARLEAGTNVKVSARRNEGQDEWFQVETDNNGQGFVHASYLTYLTTGLAPGDLFRDCADCPWMVVLPEGSFMMGTSIDKEGTNSNEGPLHEVRIDQKFAVAKFEVTSKEWNACRADGGCDDYQPPASLRNQYIGYETEKDLANLPVVNVSWHDTQVYLSWLTRKTGNTYRLLSEAEWEYAARGGKYHNNFVYRWDTNLGLSPVGANSRYVKNSFGLIDMIGNAWEWVQDCWNDSYSGAPTNGSAWISGDCSVRILRGGSWLGGPKMLRPALRFRQDSRDRHSTIGFRVARNVQ